MSARRGASWTVALLALAGCSAGGEPATTDLPAAGEPCPSLPAVVAADDVGAWDTTGVTGQRRLVLMGGSREVDDGSRALVEAASGGDVVVLRASGSTTSYNDYLHAQLGADPAPASVRTLRLQAGGSDAPGVLCRVGHAEAVWLAGGDQWNYLGVWSEVLQDSLRATAVRPAAIGGTSAGAVVLGELAFDAEHGTVTSETALADPHHPKVSVRRSRLAQPELGRFLVDSHFMQRDREGRLLAFLARGAPLLSGDTVYGLGLDERAAIILDDNRFTVRAAPDRFVWLYRYVAGPAEPSPGTPLNVAGIVRARLAHGVTGAWPPALDTLPTDTLDVVQGEVEAR